MKLSSIGHTQSSIEHRIKAVFRCSPFHSVQVNGSGLVWSQAIFWICGVHFCNHDILCQFFVQDFFQRFASLFKGQDWFIFVTRYGLKHLLWFAADIRSQSGICIDSASHLNMFTIYFRNGEICYVCDATGHVCFDKNGVVQINGKRISTQRKRHLFSFFHQIIYCFSIQKEINQWKMS